MYLLVDNQYRTLIHFIGEINDKEVITVCKKKYSMNHPDLTVYKRRPDNFTTVSRDCMQCIDNLERFWKINIKDTRSK